MTARQRTRRILAILFYGTALVLVLFFILTLLAMTGEFTFQAIGHALGGWGLFLRRNLHDLSLDPAILVSGLVSSIAALVLLHLLASRVFRISGWRPSSSFAVLGGTAVIFAASFLVPGVLMILRTPMDGPWTKRSPSQSVRVEARDLYPLLMWHASEHDRFPDSLDQLLDSNDISKQDRHLILGAARIGVMYPGAGFPMSDDSEFLLLVFPPVDDGTSTALFANGSVSRISSSRLEMLLDQTAEAFRRTNPR